MRPGPIGPVTWTTVREPESVLSAGGFKPHACDSGPPSSLLCDSMLSSTLVYAPLVLRQ